MTPQEWVDANPEAVKRVTQKIWGHYPNWWTAPEYRQATINFFIAADIPSLLADAWNDGRFSGSNTSGNPYREK